MECIFARDKPGDVSMPEKHRRHLHFVCFRNPPRCFRNPPRRGPPEAGRVGSWHHSPHTLPSGDQSDGRVGGVKKTTSWRVYAFIPPPTHWNSNKMSLFVRATGCLLSGAFFFPSPLWAVAVMPLLSQKKNNHKTARQHSFSPHSSFSQ